MGDLREQEFRQIYYILKALEEPRERRPLTRLPFDLLQRALDIVLLGLERAVGRLVDVGLKRLEKQRKR